VPILHFDELWLLTWSDLLEISTRKFYHIIILK
jgi:hypothetical protein